ncbi:hypothetical protein AB0F77_38100 [Streptomyces sp. NPDC026672]|uniref:hypothetical protein n=1 Tax=unclassified Streptomyces TaxID=2593676 RepID=UPI00340F2EF4
MTCPHCRASLLLKERRGNVCSRCGRPYALDPRTQGRGMHDTRILRIADKATGGGRRQVTVTQLRYLARTANRTWPATPRSGRPQWIGRTVAVVLVAGLVALGFRLRDVPPAGLIWWAAAIVALLVYAVSKGEPRRPARSAGASVTPAQATFRSMMSTRWTQVYGSLPPGIVDDEQHPGEAGGLDGGPSEETVELLCPDRAVRVFLALNGFPRRLGLRLAAGLGDLSGTGPVVVLHDAGARGLQLVEDARAVRPRRVVVDAGLPVCAVLGNRRAVTLHETLPVRMLENEPEWLRRTTRLAPREAAWLRQGWYSPVAAAPPALVEAAVERAVRQAHDADPERREAAAVGFMSWPSESAAKDGD